MDENLHELYGSIAHDIGAVNGLKSKLVCSTWKKQSTSF